MRTACFPRLLLIGFMVLLTLVIAPPAFAAPPQVTILNIDVTINPDPVFSPACGFPVETQFVGKVKLALHVDNAGKPVFEIDTSPGFRTTFTNPANGKSFSTPNVTMNITTFTQDSTTGTITLHGLNYRIVVPGQGVVFLQTGRVVLDQNGQGERI
jgi:hypothetical protein